MGLFESVFTEFAIKAVIGGNTDVLTRNYVPIMLCLADISSYDAGTILLLLVSVHGCSSVRALTQQINLCRVKQLISQREQAVGGAHAEPFF